MGHYDLLAEAQLAQLPRFCHLELRPLVEACQVRRIRQQAPPVRGNSAAPFTPVGTPPPSVTSNPARSVPPSATPRPVVSREPGLRSPSASAAPKKVYTVACIDDSPTVLNAIDAFLDDTAFKVLRIDNPVSALMKIIRNKPDLILLDVTMPNLDGYELCSLLRRHTLFKHTPIIMVTGNTGLIDRAKAKLVGASGYLTKPFAQPDLLKIVFKHLK